MGILKPHELFVASYPGSRIKGLGGKESLVYTVCARMLQIFPEFWENSIRPYSSVLTNSAEFIECYIRNSLCVFFVTSSYA